MRYTRTRTILFLTSGILAVLVAALLVGKVFHERKPSAQPVQEGIVSEETLVKGCLFDLGIAKDQARITERTVEVETYAEFSEIEILEAFGPLGEQARIKIHDPSRVELYLHGNPWEIIIRKPHEKLARIAIIVDDLGLDVNVARQLCSIDADLTFSILPKQPHSKKIAKYLHSRDREILLHLPMEGNGKDPGPGAVFKGMTPEEVGTIVVGNLKAVPYVVGANNHMGSVVTQDEVIMGAVYQELKKRNLFFIDSLTTGRSICSELAAQVDIPFTSRDVFLDNEQDYVYIRSQLKKLVSIARLYSSAIGICHPYPTTIEVLTKELPRLKQEGVSIERASTFVAVQQ
ncbi:MAG: divergent polysaccharide deacetylase family protein [Desulfomonilia bacterium]